jgi:hypothetical protein
MRSRRTDVLSVWIGAESTRTTYVPSLCESVLVLVVQRLLVIDVAIDLNKVCA